MKPSWISALWLGPHTMIAKKKKAMITINGGGGGSKGTLAQWWWCGTMSMWQKKYYFPCTEAADQKIQDKK